MTPHCSLTGLRLSEWDAVLPLGWRAPGGGAEGVGRGSHGVVVVGHQPRGFTAGGVLEAGVVGVAEDPQDPR